MYFIQHFLESFLKIDKRYLSVLLKYFNTDEYDIDISSNK